MPKMHEIDFLPERLRSQRARRRRIACQAYMLCACLAVMSLVGYVRHGLVSEARAELNDLNGQVEEIRQQLSLRAELELQQVGLRVLSSIETDLGSRIEILDVLAELERVMPTSIALANLDLETLAVRVAVTPVLGGARTSRGSLKHKSQSIKRLRLMITGQSPTETGVANLVGQLTNSPLFEDVDMDFAREGQFRGRKAREFQISCYVVR